VKFIILLHKVAYDYVTLFDVYECTISPDVLERKIQEAERRLEERYFLLVTPQEWMTHVSELKLFDLLFDEPAGMYRSKDTPGLRSFLESNYIEFECLSEAGFDQINPDRQQQLAAVKRWYFKIGDASSQNSALPSSRESPYFSRCSMTVPPSSEPFVRRPNAMTSVLTPTSDLESHYLRSASL